jgi:hypothetical protein
LVILPLLGGLSAAAWDALEQLREIPEEQGKARADSDRFHS